MPEGSGGKGEMREIDWNTLTIGTSTMRGMQEKETYKSVNSDFYANF